MKKNLEKKAMYQTLEGKTPRQAPNCLELRNSTLQERIILARHITEASVSSSRKAYIDCQAPYLTLKL